MRRAPGRSSPPAASLPSATRPGSGGSGPGAPKPTCAACSRPTSAPPDGGADRRSAEALVGVAPTPGLAGFDAAHDGVVGGLVMGGGVPADGRGAAAHLAAGEAHAEMDGAQALVDAALGDGCR